MFFESTQTFVQRKHNSKFEKKIHSFTENKQQRKKTFRIRQKQRQKNILQITRHTNKDTHTYIHSTYNNRKSR